MRARPRLSEPRESEIARSCKCVVIVLTQLHEAEAKTSKSKNYVVDKIFDVMGSNLDSLVKELKHSTLFDVMLSYLCFV